MRTLGEDLAILDKDIARADAILAIGMVDGQNPSAA
jgi:hypothetical protein